MTDYTGACCPLCKKDFTGERPVVCPDCGAPYHRACYAEEGGCVFTKKHGSGFSWENIPDEIPRSPRSGYPAAMRQSGQDSPGPHAEESKPANKEKNYYGSIRETLDEMGFFKDEFVNVNNAGKEKLSPDERFMFGVSEKEIAHFQGGITPLRLLRYRRIASGNKLSLNILAGLLSPLYMFYARMRGLGFIVALFTFMLSFPSLLDVYFGLTGVVSPFAPEQLMQMSANLSFLNFSMAVIIALFYDYIYLRWSANKIKFIRSRFYPELSEQRAGIPDAPSVSAKLEGLEDDYYDYLQYAGSPGLRYVLRDFIITSVAMFFLLHLIVVNFIVN
ncbi:MAG: hypothetical protein FWE74_00995 [Oscillospiraceae bacterium]|nr:hypothetical protein [Oscillospiraceae bacterium]